MATRPVFSPSLEGESLVKINYIDFDWFPGMSLTQKQKSIDSLHQNYRDFSKNQNLEILEVSRRSKDEIGIKLSAFNLMIPTKSGRLISVESLFQSSKVFKSLDVKTGPYRDLMYKSPKEAKTDERLKTSGNLIEFSYQPNPNSPEEIWDLWPKTAFYDWIYLNALNISPIKAEIMKYDAFTDIEFNPNKSVNCQAYTVALYKSLIHRKLITDKIPKKNDFLSILNSFEQSNSSDSIGISQKLF